MLDKVTVLDHGYVQMIESWGSDETIIASARMSTNKGFRHWGMKACEEHKSVGPMAYCNECKGDEKLLRYLYEKKHLTPFEMAGMTIEVQAPIFVFREWHRHRSQSFNEMSARYTPLPDVNYLPTEERCLMVGGANKQAGKAKDAAELTQDSVSEWLDLLNNLYEKAEDVYQDGLKRGIPKELARLSVPVARYSKMRASANLRAWLMFLTLRMDTAAQYEIRMYANEVAKLVKQTFPRTYELFAEGAQ